MSLLKWFLGDSEEVIKYAPGGMLLPIRLIYNPKTEDFEYRGRFGILEKFNAKDITEVVLQTVSKTHVVLLVQGADTCLATFDVLPNLIAENAKAWIDSRGTVAYDYNEQLKGNWSNMADMSRGMPHPQGGEMLSTTNEMDKNVTEADNAAADSAITVAAVGKDDPFDALKKLKELLEMGIITEDEFANKKAELLKKI